MLIVSTYRLQLRREFGFDEAIAVLGYLAELGVTHVYCSPWLQAAPGSAHGYDVIDHTRVGDDLGGRQAYARFVARCRENGLGIVLDIVPNHMAISAPQSQNALWWSLLRDGRHGEHAGYFDVDFDAGPILVPVLGGPLAEVADDLRLDGDRIRYFDHEVPIAPGTLVEGNVLATLARQHYRLCDWRVAAEELNVRRFFDVTELAGLRVEDPVVFDATHGLVLEQIRAGDVAGLRIDHPDGLADPAGYLDRLAVASGGVWTVVEKILESGEQLPRDWATAGTTGYDALNRVLGLFVDPAGEEALTALWESRTGSRATFAEVALASKHLILDQVLGAEVNRLVRVAYRALLAQHRDVTERGLREALIELLAAFEVYRAYVRPGEPADAGARTRVADAASAARLAVPHRAREVDLLAALALADDAAAPEFTTRFQQTCGPVMAKGVEDTAFYRYLRLAALNEVGGDPGRFGISLSQFHTETAAAQRDWPLTQTALSTHDTKRSEDVRARLVLLSQLPEEWAETVARWSAAAQSGLDGPTELLVWQSLVGAWPIEADRACAYLEKATREAKQATSWVAPDADYDRKLAAFVAGVLADEALCAGIEAFVERLRPAWESTMLAQKLIQLMLPGVADTYQGTELVDLSLVDPDNRRPVDYASRRAALADLETAPAKLALTATALRLRRDHPSWFLSEATYEPLDAGSRAVAFMRSGEVVVVAPTRAVHGWDGDAVTLPPGRWRSLLPLASPPLASPPLASDSQEVDTPQGIRRNEEFAGTVALTELLAPVALLVRA